MNSITEEPIGPINEIVARVWEILAGNVPADLHWRTLLLTVAIGILIYSIRGGLGARSADGRADPKDSGASRSIVSYLLPKDIYTHVSARVDVWLWVLERVLRPIWAASVLLTVAPATERVVMTALSAVWSESPGLEVNYGWMLLYSLVILLLYDLVCFTIHYTMHKVPALWAIHKVHHSAEVLTPLTRYREHFLAGPIWASGAAVSYGFAAGVFGWLFRDDITQATLFNVGFFAVLFGFAGSFRHYHVQFRYWPWLEKWLQSPAMHHVHHSYLEEHWDKNFAAVTSIYDRLFSTLYIPETDEYTPWGIGPETQAEYRTFWQNTRGPFADWYRMLRGVSPQAGGVSQRESDSIGFRGNPPS